MIVDHELVHQVSFQEGGGSPMDTLKYQALPCHNFPRHTLLHYHILYPATIIIPQ